MLLSMHDLIHDLARSVLIDYTDPLGAHLAGWTFLLCLCSSV
jgi:hypothetical protein